MKTVSDVTLSYLVEKLLSRISGSENRVMTKLSGSEDKCLQENQKLSQALQAHLNNKSNPHAVQFSQLTGKALLEAVYPVGAIYMSTRSTSPAALFGGSWARIQDRFLLAAGSGYAPGTVGGASSQVLTENQMPKHRHIFYIGEHNAAPLDVPFDKTRTAMHFSGQEQYNSGSLDGTIIGSAGGSQSFSIMPPYQAVYVWQRTA